MERYHKRSLPGGRAIVKINVVTQNEQDEPPPVIPAFAGMTVVAWCV
jgi:hypothetical protein